MSALRPAAHLLSSLLLLSFAVPGIAQADPLTGVVLDWRAPRECPDRVALDTALKRDLTGSESKGQRLEVHATVEQDSSGTYSAVVRMQDGTRSTERKLVARTCAELVEATSLIVAMVIDPEVAVTNNLRETTAQNPDGLDDVQTPSLASAQTAPDVVATTPRPTIPPTGSVSKPSGHVVPRASGSWGLVAGWAAVDRGTLPATTLALGGTLGFLHGAWRAESSLGYWLPRDKSTETTGSAPGGRFSTVAGSVRLCARLWHYRPLVLAPCAGAEMARWSAEGNAQLATPHTVRLWSASAIVGLLGTIEVTNRLSFRLDLQAAVGANRPRFGYTQNGEQIDVFQPSWLVLRAGAGAELRFH